MNARLRVAMAVAPEWAGVFFPPPIRASMARAHDLVAPPRDTDPRDRETFRALIADADAVVTSWGCPPLDADLLGRAPRLRLLAHTGASVRPFVTSASWERGVRVTQAGAGMALSVAEACLAHTLSLLHRMHRFDHSLRRGLDWDAATEAPARHTLNACPVGVIGASRTGRAYLAMVRSLGARTLLYDPLVSAEQAQELGASLVDLDSLLASSRVVAVHAPALPETRHLLGTRELALMPDGAILVNTARSWLVDQDALLAELRSGRLDAGLDVYDTEPLPTGHPLRALPNVLLVPHQAGGTVEARRHQGEIVAAELDRFARGQPLVHEVTAAALKHMG